MGMYPTPETTPENRKHMDQTFRALACTYSASMEVIDDPKQQMPIHVTRVAVEESADSIDLQDFIHPTRCAYYVGNSDYPSPSEWCKADYIIRISVPVAEHPLYGQQALAIVLNDRYIKNGSKL